MPSEVSVPNAVQAREPTVDELKRELAEARDQQTATSEILRVISISPSSAQPVFAEIAKSSARLCNAYDAIILLKDGDVLRRVAHEGPIPIDRQVGQGSIPLTRDFLMGRAVLERRTAHVEDLQAEVDEYPEGSEVARRLGLRTMLAVPLIRVGEAIGVVALRRLEKRPFSDRQIELLRTFADQAVIAIENARLFEEEQARKRELQQSLEYQNATGEVLGVIARSPTDVQPVFNTIARSAAQLCNAQFCHVFRFDGDLIHFVASHGLSPKVDEAMRAKYPMPPGRASAAARSILTATVEEIPDVDADPDFEHGDVARLMNYRSIVAVPMTKDGRPIGAIVLVRPQAGHFPDRQINLLKTFADQAVIAIENTRLFQAEQTRTRELTERTHELTETLEYQTATNDVLGIISRSPNELQPVFDDIVETAQRLCEAYDASIVLRVGERLKLKAHVGPIPMRAEWPLGNRGLVASRSVMDRKTVHVHDLAAAEGEFPEGREDALKLGHRSILAVPLVYKGEGIGTLIVRRFEVRPFSDRQIALLATFADQAVIAIENTRLFEEVQARTRELTESLEYQTATSEVLGVISRSTFDLQTVLDTLTGSAAQLCDAEMAGITRYTDGAYHHVTSYGLSPEVAEYFRTVPLDPGQSSVVGRVLMNGATVHIADVLADPAYSMLEAQRKGGFRTVLGVPLLREGTPIGVIVLYRLEVRPFTGKQIALVETFADQAVIAIENVRLFEAEQASKRELARSVQELQALGEVGRAVSSTLDLKVVLKTIVDRAVHLSGTDAGSIFYYREEIGKFELGETTGLDEQVVARFRKLDISLRETGLGEAIAKRQPLQIPDLTQRPSEPLRDAVLEAGFRASLVVPLLGAERPLGTLILRRRSPGEFPATVVSLMQSFADQSAIALENARLFDEIAQKGRELEIASQHKSQFVANMSHELRTPLAAILGYAELMQEGFYEPQGKKSLDALTRIRSNGKHLLGLINTVLDIAKIESGQFSLNLGEYAIESVVETVRVATESLAEAKKLSLKTDVAKRLPVGLGDEQRLTQVLLNLVGNAIKFTDSGEVRITATAMNGHFTVAVTDTGPGIPPEELKRVFEHFHQVDNSNTKAKGGTGLGLAIAKQIVEMHGGRIWVESALGKGATFQMELPVRTETRKGAA